MPSDNPFLTLYRNLLDSLGPQGWWPGDSPFEIAVGAILTQNTNWHNVARAIAALKQDAHLSPQALWDMPAETLAAYIRPAGYYNVKTRRLKNFLQLLFSDFQGSMEQMAAHDLATLRPALLAVKGIGPETADSILLYALEKPTFVIDAYTFRILGRHGLAPDPCSYDDLQTLLCRHLPVDVPLYQEYHALFVRTAKDFCRTRPRCQECPLAGQDDAPSF